MRIIYHRKARSYDGTRVQCVGEYQLHAAPDNQAELALIVEDSRPRVLVSGAAHAHFTVSRLFLGE